MASSLPRLLPKASDSPDHEFILDSGQGPITLRSTDLPRKRPPVASACEKCRKRKSKCNGLRPQCDCCERLGVVCKYEAPQGLTSRQADRARVANYRSLIELLREGTLADFIQILERLRAAEDADEDEADGTISEVLSQLPVSTPPTDARTKAKAQKQSSVTNNHESPDLLIPPVDDVILRFDETFTPDIRDLYVDSRVFLDLSACNLPLSRFTSVSTDDQLMNHLLKLFFTWDDGVERIIYRPAFEEDLKTLVLQPGDVGSSTYCSKFLVNALLAVSCLYTLDPVTFKDPDDSRTRGRQWLEEAETHLESVHESSILLLQGLNLMWTYEGNLGNKDRAMYYFTAAVNVCNILNTDDGSKCSVRDRHVSSWCMWGSYIRDWQCSQAMNTAKFARKPKIDKLWRDRTFALSDPNAVGYWWYPYTISLKVQRSMQVEIREAEAGLAEIWEDVLNSLYAGPPPIENVRRALELYANVQAWRLACPSRVRLEDAVLPGAIFLHIGVEVILTAILRPFCCLTREQFGEFDPRERCYHHAHGIVTTVWMFRAFAILRYSYWLVYAVSVAVFIVLPTSPASPLQTDILIRGCQCLSEMKPSLPLAIDVLHGIRAAFEKCDLPVPDHLKKYLSVGQPRIDPMLPTVALLPGAAEPAREKEITAWQLDQLLADVESLDMRS